MATTTTAAAPPPARTHSRAGRRHRPGQLRRRHRPGQLRRRLGDNLMAYTFLAAALVCFALFSWYPLIRSITLSFQKDYLVPGVEPEWVGWENYRTMFADPLFGIAIRNTLEFTSLALLFGFVVPLAMAILLNELRHFKTYFRLAVYLPVMLPPIVGVMLWQFFYDPGRGLFNVLLEGAHLPTSQWVQSSKTAMLSLVLVSTWANMGGSTLMYLAALQSMPPELYESSELDGAGLWKRIWHLTLPHMRFIMLVMLLLQITATMQVFVEPFQLTGFTNPDTVTVMLLIYRYAFGVEQDFGLAAAPSVLLFITLSAFAAIYLRITRERTV